MRYLVTLLLTADGSAALGIGPDDLISVGRQARAAEQIQFGRVPNVGTVPTVMKQHSNGL